MAESGSEVKRPPPELVAAVDSGISSEFDRLPEGGCHKLLYLGKRGRGNYTWGFRIYRTTYKKLNSDADFARAIEVLNDYIRMECFSHTNGERDLGYFDGEANRQLWQRLRHEIVQDCDLLNGASETPARMHKVHQDWVHSHPGARVDDHSFYRYFLVIDDEVIDHLLHLPMPANEEENSIASAYSVKLYDTWSQLGEEFYGYVPDPLEDEGMCKDEEMEAYEGWFWMSAYNMVAFWFAEDNAAVEELFKNDDSWGGEWRLVHHDTEPPSVGCRDPECRAKGHGFYSAPKS